MNNIIILGNLPSALNWIDIDMQSFSVTSNMHLRACLHGGWAPQIGEVTCSGSPHLSCKRNQIKMRDYRDRWVTTPKRVTSPTWDPPPPCKPALNPVKSQSKATGLFTAAAVSEPEANKWGSSLIGKKLHYRGIQSLFLAKCKESWLCTNERFKLCNGVARNCGYVRMEDLGCTADSQGIVVMLEWEI